MIDDLLVNGEFFDADFFAYREDADVAWRAQLYGWRCLYTPQAVAYHVRHVLPENRAAVSPILNMHSVKNRWLMRIKNITPRLYLQHIVAITWRDLFVIGGCLLKEFSSLRAFVIVFRLWNTTWNKRRAIMQKRRASDEYLASWFSNTPVSFPAGAIAAGHPGQKESGGQVSATCSLTIDAHRFTGNAWNSGYLWRVRNLRRRNFSSPRRARPRCYCLLPRAISRA